MRQIDEFGVGVLIRRVIERVKAQGGMLHVSLDVDFLDPITAPGVGTMVQGGATYREAHYIRVTVNSVYEPLFPLHFGSYDSAVGGYPVSATAGMRTE